jgi:hypothetical protein
MEPSGLLLTSMDEDGLLAVPLPRATTRAPAAGRRVSNARHRCSSWIGTVSPRRSNARARMWPKCRGTALHRRARQIAAGVTPPSTAGRRVLGLCTPTMVQTSRSLVT